MANQTNTKLKKPTSNSKSKPTARALSRKSAPKIKASPTNSTKLAGEKAKRLKPLNTNLPSSFRLFGRACAMLARRRKTFAWMLLTYALLFILLVHANLLASSGLHHLKNTSSSNSLLGGFGLGFTMLIYLLGNGSAAGSSGSSTNSGPPYNALLAIVMSLVIIWALRQLYAGVTVRARDAFYNGLTALVPFILILMVVSLELLPGILGGFLYGTVMTNGIAATAAEKALWAILLILLVLLSFYLITSSIFALYVVTLPDMTPMKALRSARQLVFGRRFLVLRKVAFLPFALMVLIIILMVPILVLATAAAPAILFLLLLASLFVVHSYMYGLYRELLV